MVLDFTKIEWAGKKCILITSRKNSQVPVLILDKIDIERLNKEFKDEKQ